MKIEFYWKNVIKTLIVIMIFSAVVLELTSLLDIPLFIGNIVAAIFGWNVEDLVPWNSYSFKDQGQ